MNQLGSREEEGKNGGVDGAGPDDNYLNDLVGMNGAQAEQAIIERQIREIEKQTKAREDAEARGEEPGLSNNISNL